MNGMLFVAVRAVRPPDAPAPVLRGVPSPSNRRFDIARFLNQPVRVPRFGRKWGHVLSRAEAP
jgi:hypothetical protein